MVTAERTPAQDASFALASGDVPRQILRESASATATDGHALNYQDSSHVCMDTQDMLPTLQSRIQHGGRTGGPVERVEPRISGDNAEPLLGSFPTDLDGLASRLDVAARLTSPARVRHLMPKNHRPQHLPQQATAGRRAPKNHR
jgi:hypothetical protein